MTGCSSPARWLSERVDRRVEPGLEDEVEQQRDQAEEHDHHAREGQRQAHPHGQPAEPRADTPRAPRSTAPADLSPHRVIDAQPVAGAADRLEHLRAERPVELVAQVADVDVDHVRAVLVAVVPDVLEQLEAAQHLARVGA